MKGWIQAGRSDVLRRFCGRDALPNGKLYQSTHERRPETEPSRNLCCGQLRPSPPSFIVDLLTLCNKPFRTMGTIPSKARHQRGGPDRRACSWGAHEPLTGSCWPPAPGRLRYNLLCLVRITWVLHSHGITIRSARAA